ncbi:ribonuclease H-like domain-containing protein [Tanacetum coccineum]
MDSVRPRGSYSSIKRSYYTKPAFRPKDLKQDVKTFRVKNMTNAGTIVVVHTGKGKMDTDLKKSRRVWRPKGNYLDHVSKDSGLFMLKKGNPEILLQDHAVLDSGCSSHMTGNKAYLSDYEDYNGGFVAFGSDPKGDELKFNLFSISQMCDKKNSVLFSETECLILSPSFKLLNESQVVLRAPRKDDVYSLDLKNIVPSRGSSGKDKEPTQEYHLLPLHPHRTRIPVEDVAPAAHENPSESTPKVNDVQDSEDVAKKEGQHQMTKDEQVLHDDLEKMITQEATSTSKLSVVRSSVSTATTPYVCTASTPSGANAGESSFVYLGGKIPIDASTLPNADLPIDPNMADLEDASNAFSNDGIFNGAYDDKNVGAVADFNNMDDTINVSPIPILRIHKDYLKDQILGDPKLAVQTRGKIQKDSLAQQALFKLQKVWILVDLPSGRKAIGTKWVFKNKRDERIIVVKNKARLVAQGFRQEEGIDYDEVFAPVVRIEAIRLFLAFASYMGFTVYQMDDKSAFLYGAIEEEVYVHQPLGFVDPAHPNKVYKIIKALYGLHQAPRACQDKYVADILKKFDFWSIRIASTPIESNKPLIKDEDGKDVDVHVYGSMIGSLMYLTASRPDIMFAICVCARFQVTPKASHLNVVKWIFRYLKHQPKLGLWYPRDSPFDLEAFSDSDYRGASLDRKSTIGGCQFLGRRLISWQCKKQTIMANSTTEAEYVAAAKCCGQVLWIQNQMMDYGFNFILSDIAMRKD